MVEVVTFLLAAAACLAGAAGVVAAKHPVHSALSLIATLFGIAVMFLLQGAYFLAAIQVIVYAGAIVVVILFVVMLLGVDKAERLGDEPLAGQRVAAAVTGITVLTLLGVILMSGNKSTTAPGAKSLDQSTSDVLAIGRSLFTDHVWVFELTSALLVIAVVAAVALARKPEGEIADAAEYEAHAAAVEDRVAEREAIRVAARQASSKAAPGASATDAAATGTGPGALPSEPPTFDGDTPDASDSTASDNTSDGASGDTAEGPQ